MILIVSHPDDDHATAVLGELSVLNHPALLVDTSRYPVSTAVIERFGGGPPSFALTLSGQPVPLDECRAGWWRRALPYTFDPALASDAVSFAYNESSEAVAGLWEALPVTWVNRPSVEEPAHHKPYQLAVATEVGLPVPRTLITNDPAAAQAFVGELGVGRVVYKTFLASEEHWRETRRLRPEEVALLSEVRLAPVIFQEYVPAVADVRVTIVGEQLFAAAIQATPGGYDLDYRMDMDGAIFEPTKLPGETEKGLRRFMERLGLVYGALDLRRTPGGDHVFLEINPSGEWLFVEERTGQPISHAMASLLCELDSP